MEPMDVEIIGLKKQFNIVEQYFQHYVFTETYNIIQLVNNSFPSDPNVCCNVKERFFLLKIANQLKRCYPFVSNKDLCTVVIYTYYSLNLNENSSDIMNLEMFRAFSDNFNAVKEIYLQITIGDIFFEGKNLSSAIRRFMLFGETKGYYGGETVLTTRTHTPKKKERKTFSKKTN